MFTSGDAGGPLGWNYLAWIKGWTNGRTDAQTDGRVRRTE